ncbi:LysR family transcriptional regulator [Litoreibacter roseus]|uniref:Transcriptional regulator n=1 Tax=Litoreibacter roseus TaxID=2601869 RepID=A0A6N6JHT1_9RHOB|nr:LysR family transcriptional regulator [Litoreibacter roseus]GFE64782.1 transcriptional regulator [Litoreibacter roseus]
MDWRQIPSLSALRAFEATARLSSFSAAARDLNVTHAAIAQHVRGLESYFGRSLVFRQGQFMELTADGKALATALSHGFETISEGVHALRVGKETRPLKIALTPTFAENWLMPRVGAFWSAHPGIELALVPSGALVDLQRDDFDLAIRYGHGHWPGTQADFLAPANYIIAGTRALIGECAPAHISDLTAFPWLFETGRDEQRVWAAEEGLDLKRTQVTEFATNGLVLSAARAGYGLTMQARALIEADLAAGTLVCVYEAEQTSLGYYILTRAGLVSSRAQTFISWLKSSA